MIYYRIESDYNDYPGIYSEICSYLSSYEGEEKVKLIGITPKNLERVIFPEESELHPDKYYSNKRILLCRDDWELIKKLDLSDITFRNVDIDGLDFTGSYGVKINPQIVFDKSCRLTKFKDVEFVGSFDDVDIYGADFTGSKEAFISISKVRDCRDTNFNDAFVVGLYGNNKTDANVKNKVKKREK